MFVCEPLPTEGYKNVSVRNVDAAARMAKRYFCDEVEVVEPETTNEDVKRKSVFDFGAMLQLLAEADIVYFVGGYADYRSCELIRDYVENNGIAFIDHDPYTWMSLHIKSSS